MAATGSLIDRSLITGRGGGYKKGGGGGGFKFKLYKKGELKMP